LFKLAVAVYAAMEIRMSLTVWIWLCTGAYALHILEEFEFDWRDWARAVIKLPVEWADFYVVNGLVVVLGIVAANVATEAPVVALVMPALMLVNATFFHVLPFLRRPSRFQPGLATAVVLFYPVAIATYSKAIDAGVGWGGVIVSLLCGCALMAYPIVLLKLKSHPFFRQD